MILPRDKIVALTKLARKKGYKIVTANGVFDILHAGHLRYLSEAKGMGGKNSILIVLINSDKSTRLNKGEKKPLVPANERAEIIDSLKFVDYVVIFDELTPIYLLSEITPDIHVKGGDYTPETMIETEAVHGFGGSVATSSYVQGRSTSNLIQEIVQRFG